MLHQTSGFDVNDEIVTCSNEVEIKDALSPTEMTVVDAFRSIGSAADLHTLEERCVQAGMNIDTFRMSLSTSPLIRRQAQGVYSLVGAEIPPGAIASATKAVSRKRRRTRSVLQNYGWKNPETVWIEYHVSAGLLRNGVCSVPTAFKDICLGEYELRVPGEGPIARLKRSGNQMWGLLQLFSRKGVDVGDHLVLFLNHREGVAMAHLGDEGLRDDLGLS